MEKEKTYRLISEAAKSIFTYCRARTDSREDAEDLSQDILQELLRTQSTLRDDKAFYGFMWALAGNVYKNWCKKRKKIIGYELDDNILDDSISFTELFERESDLHLLYRELGLLTAQYRKVIIMYYFNDEKVSEISKSLGITESMVKFLLFKSRKILKEGMNMERAIGDLSFNPVKMVIRTLRAKTDYSTAEHSHSMASLVNGNLISQNILFTCYNDRCTTEEISLQIGIAVPYLEKDLKNLCEKGLLIHKGGKYETDILILSKEFSEEAEEKILPVYRKIAELFDKCLNERISDIKSVGFYTGVEDDNLLKWHVMHILLHESGMKYADSLNFTFPKKYGMEAIVYVEEHYPSNSGTMTNLERNNANGDIIAIHDFSIINTKDCVYFDRYPNRVNIILDIAKGKSAGFSENDISEIAEFIKRGYVRKTGGELSLKFPILTKNQYKEIKNLFDGVIIEVAGQIQEAVNITTNILVQHTPVSMKKNAENIGWVKARDCGFVSVKLMVDNGMLQRVADNAHPTMYVLLV